eukprot:gene4140-biopygen21892
MQSQRTPPDRAHDLSQGFDGPRVAREDQPFEPERADVLPQRDRRHLEALVSDSDLAAPRDPRAVQFLEGQVQTDALGWVIRQEARAQRRAGRVGRQLQPLRRGRGQGAIVGEAHQGDLEVEQLGHHIPLHAGVVLGVGRCEALGGHYVYPRARPEDHRAVHHRWWYAVGEEVGRQLAV